MVTRFNQIHIYDTSCDTDENLTQNQEAVINVQCLVQNYQPLVDSILESVKTKSHEMGDFAATLSDGVKESPLPD